MTKLTKTLFLCRVVFIKAVLIKLVTTSAVSPTLVNTEARVMKCVTSQREDSTAHVYQPLADTGVNYLSLVHVRTSRNFQN